jgi:hypothetical protein
VAFFIRHFMHHAGRLGTFLANRRRIQTEAKGANMPKSTLSKSKRSQLPKSERNTKQPWTADQVKQLRQLAKGNTPTRVIGLKLGRTESAIYAKARSSKISLQPPNRSPYG